MWGSPIHPLRQPPCDDGWQIGIGSYELERGAESCCFGKSITKAFNHSNKLEFISKSEFQQEGYQW